MFIFKKIALANRILNAYKNLKEIAENNKNCSSDVKEGFELIKKGAEKVVNSIPKYKTLYLEIVEVLKNA